MPYFTIILSYLILSYLIIPSLTLPYLTLSYLILSYLTLPYLSLSYLILFYLILSYPILAYLPPNRRQTKQRKRSGGRESGRLSVRDSVLILINTNGNLARPISNEPTALTKKRRHTREPNNHNNIHNQHNQSLDLRILMS